MTNKAAINFQRLDEIPSSQSIQIMAYGGAGTGKTWFAGTAGSRSLFINNGSGITTIKSKLFKEKYPDVNPIILTIPPLRLKDPLEGINLIRNGVNEALERYRDDFDTIVIDDSTALRDTVMGEALKFNADTGRSKTLEELNRLKYKYPIPAVQDYGTEMEFISGFFNELCNDICRPEKKHLIVLAHERLTFKKADKIGEQPILLKVGPSFTGVDKNPDYITGLFDNIWHMEAVGGGDRTFYRVRTSGDETLIAKTREAGLFKTTESDLSFQEVIRRIKENN